MADITPTAEQVALLIGIRTIDEGGAELDVFTDTTRPTAEQVDELCALAARDVSMALGNTVVSDEFAAEATQVAALRAAQAIELSFYPEASATPVEQLTAQYLSGLEALRMLVHGVAVRLR